MNALATLPLVRVHFGEFMVHKKFAPLAQPPTFRPPSDVDFLEPPTSVRIIKVEEKGSDVNLAAHLVRDAFTDVFAHAAGLTNDTDLVEPIRIVTQQRKLPVTLISPVDGAAPSLARVATGIRYVGNRAAHSQFADTVIDAEGRSIRKPGGW